MTPRDEIPVTFEPGAQTVFVLRGVSLQEAAAAANLTLDAPCGGEGTCGKCRVLLTAGSTSSTPEEQRLLTAEELQAGYRLACQTTVCGPVHVRVPETSLSGGQFQILVHADPKAVEDCRGDEPVLRKRYLRLTAPSQGDDAADISRLQAAMGPCRADLELLRALPGKLRGAKFQGTAVMDRDRLLDFEPGDSEEQSYGVAVDVGTTTLAAALVDLVSGNDIRVVCRLNPQTRYGDDVLSRIQLTRRDQAGLETLQRLVAGAIDAMIGEVCEASHVSRQQVYLMTVSGNTTMQQLFAGIDTRSLGEVPFVPAVRQGVAFPAGEAGIHIHPRAFCYMLPTIGGFVGGDTVAGILAIGLHRSTAPTLFMDVGTNGEIVLAHDGKLTAAATAAGPAFEGARITHGMRASRGAIEKVVFGERVQIHTIGGDAPAGLCGSALIDAAAELLRHGMLTPRGRFADSRELSAEVEPDWKRRMIVENGQCGYVLWESDELPVEAAVPRRVVLWQSDVRELQLASGAIRAGIELLLRRHGLRPRDLQCILIAGGFGCYIRRGNAQRIGLLPVEIDPARISFVGNTSLAGARLVALSQRRREEAESLAAAAEHVDLSLEPDFLDVYAASMVFPEQGT